jgi:hypothetical protein
MLCHCNRYLYNNQLSGSIPSELGSLSQLTHLCVLNVYAERVLMRCLCHYNRYLFNNQLSGSIPSELGSLSQLQVLCVLSVCHV